jgi:hypothetical protein
LPHSVSAFVWTKEGPYWTSVELSKLPEPSEARSEGAAGKRSSDQLTERRRGLEQSRMNYRHTVDVNFSRSRSSRFKARCRRYFFRSVWV